jgi:2-iminobutanoate/2-iminopropanoate deaminase
MTKKIITTDDAAAPGGSYSQAVMAGDLIFTAGMGPMDPDSQEIVGSTIEEQTTRTLLNLEAILAAAGASRDDVVKVTAHLEDLDRDFPGYDAAYQAFFRPPYPARTTVGSRLDGILVEIDCVALRPSL